MGTVFQLDGTPLHFSHHVCAFLERKFPDHWIGRVRPIPWPLHSPDLNLLDFFLEGFVKDTVYGEKVQNVNELHDRIVRAVHVTN
jgi:hypothetical protein